MPENAEQNNSELSFQFVWVSKMLVESVYNPGVMGGHVCLINLLPNFSFEKSWTILAHLNKNPSVFIHNTIDFGKKLFFRVFCVCFGIEFQTLHVLELTIKPYMFCNWLSKNGFEAPFQVTQAETITFFDCLLVWWKRRLSWILCLFSNP